MVPLQGIEPRSIRYERIAFAIMLEGHCLKFGGEDGIRTHDLLYAIQAFYQLNYNPKNKSRKQRIRTITTIPLRYKPQDLHVREI